MRFGTSNQGPPPKHSIPGPSAYHPPAIGGIVCVHLKCCKIVKQASFPSHEKILGPWEDQYIQ